MKVFPPFSANYLPQYKPQQFQKAKKKDKNSSSQEFAEILKKTLDNSPTICYNSIRK